MIDKITVTYELQELFTLCNNCDGHFRVWVMIDSGGIAEIA